MVKNMQMDFKPILKSWNFKFEPRLQSVLATMMQLELYQ